MCSVECAEERAQINCDIALVLSLAKPAEMACVPLAIAEASDAIVPVAATFPEHGFSW